MLALDTSISLRRLHVIVLAMLRQEGFVVETTGGAVFRNVDLSEKDWMDVDEDTGESCSIMDLEWKFEVLKIKK